MGSADSPIGRRCPGQFGGGLLVGFGEGMPEVQHNRQGRVRWGIENCSLLPPNHVQHLHAIWRCVVTGCQFSARQSMQFVLRVLASEFGGHRSY